MSKMNDYLIKICLDDEEKDQKKAYSNLLNSKYFQSQRSINIETLNSKHVIFLHRTLFENGIQILRELSKLPPFTRDGVGSRFSPYFPSFSSLLSFSSHSSLLSLFPFLSFLLFPISLCFFPCLSFLLSLSSIFINTFISSPSPCPSFSTLLLFSPFPC